MSNEYSSSFAIEQVEIMLRHCEERLSETEDYLIQLQVYDATTRLSDLDSIEKHKALIEDNQIARKVIDEITDYEAATDDVDRLNRIEISQLYVDAASANIETTIANIEARVNFSETQLKEVKALYEKLYKTVEKLRKIRDEIKARMNRE